MTHASEHSSRAVELSAELSRLTSQRSGLQLNELSTTIRASLWRLFAVVALARLAEVVAISFGWRAACLVLGFFT